MNFDELKSAWQTPDPRQGTPSPLSHSLVHVLIQQRSRGRLAELQRTLAWQGALTIGSSPLLFGLVLLNPLGLTHWYSFVPPLGWASCFLLLGVLLLVERRRLRRRTQPLANLRQALELALALQRQSLRGLGRLSLLGQLLVFATIGALTAERGAQMSGWEAIGAWGITLFFAGLTIYHFYTKQVPRIARLHHAQEQAWLSELAELQATEE